MADYNFYRDADVSLVWIDRKNKSIEAYQSQVTVIERMKAEMIRLRAMVCSESHAPQVVEIHRIGLVRNILC